MRHRALDGWRGMGAMAVAVLHFKATGFLTDLPPLDCLTLAVDFFFVLSGFVIARVYTDELAGGGRSIVFAIRRFGRLWPLHVFILVALVAIELLKLAVLTRTGQTSGLPPFSEARDPSMILPNLFLVQAFLSPSELSWNYPSWSISAEFWTYLIFALLVVTGPAQLRSRLVVFAGLALAAWLAVLIGAADGMKTTGDFAVARCVAGFFTGVTVERLYSRGLLCRFSTGRFEILASALAVVMIVGASRLPTVRFAAPVVFAFLVIAHAGDGGPLSRLLCTRPLQWLGRLSYSIYMTHALLLAYIIPRLNGVIARRLVDQPLLAELTISILFLSLLLGVSDATHRLVELPGQRFFSTIAKSFGTRVPISSRVGGPTPG